MEKISFIILTHNSNEYIKRCLESIENIKSFEIEIIIADNGSTDNTIKIIENFKKDNIKIIKLKKNYGTTISRNKCLHLIKNTDFICILDSDTIINTDAIEKMIEYLKMNSNVGIVGPGMKGLNNKKQLPYRKFPTWKIKLLKTIPIKKLNSKGIELESYKIKDDIPFECDYLISACWMMQYDTYKKVGDLDEKIFYAPEDVEYCIRVKENNLKVVHLPYAQIIHVYQRISKKKLISKANITHIIGINYTLKKHKKFLKQYRKETK
jgi:GT2 family glycosyltransferase